MQKLRVVCHGLAFPVLCGTTLVAAACAGDPSALDPGSRDGSPAGTTHVPARLARAQTGQVGYHAMLIGLGPAAPIPSPDWDAAQDWQIPAVVLGGGAPVPVDDPSAAALANLDVLWVETWAYTQMTWDEQWMARQPDLDAAVQNGMVLVVHDDATVWTGLGFRAEALPLPGAVDLIPTQDPFPAPNVIDINIRDGSTQVTSGLIDSSFDLRGEDLVTGRVTPPLFVNASLLPPNAKLILSRTAPDEIVTFCYPHGKGAVIYSTIWLSEYTGDLEGSDYYPADLQNAMTKIYAPNVVRYALAGACKQ